MIAHVFRPKRRVGGKVVIRRIYRGRYRLSGDFAITEVSLATSDRQVAEKRLRDIISESERERAGLIAPRLQRDSAQKPLAEHLRDFLADLAAMGRTEKYRHDIHARVSTLLGACSWRQVADVSGDAFVSWRSRQTRLSPKTLNEYLNAASVLLNWMKRQGRIAENPLLTIQPSDTRGRTERKRAFSEEELERLLRVARQHRLIYLTAAYTGLRLGELRQLVWGDLKLGDLPAHIVVRALTAKNRREAVVPLHPMLLEELKAARPRCATDASPVFTRCRNADRRIRRDMEAASIARFDAMGRKLCFHSLRYTFATKLARSGASQRLVQELMRHSDPRLTANLYTDVSRLPTFETVSGLAWHGGVAERDERPEGSQLRSQKSAVPGPSGSLVVAPQPPSALAENVTTERDPPSLV
jgi:integrase